MTFNNITLIYNGELYNTEEMRHELTAKGHDFRTASDTEVLLHAYAEWGTAAFARLNGDYAFALYEPTERRLTLCRDRLGVKPLFYSRIGRDLVFASEQKALLCHPAVKPLLDADGLRNLLLFGPARPPEDGIFHQVRALLPAHYAVCTPKSFEIHAYWQLTASDAPPALPVLREQIVDATLRRLRAEVPQGIFLSGGLSSAVIATIAARETTGKPLDTFSFCYRDQPQYFAEGNFSPKNDSEYTDFLAAQLATNHEKIELGSEALCAALLPATDARDLPGMADFDSALLLFCSQVRHRVGMVLSGEGAFGRAAFPDFALRLPLLAPGLLQNSEEYVRETLGKTRREADRLPSDSTDMIAAREAYYLYLKWVLPCLIERADRMSMYSGLEIRLPFCDHRLVEAAYNLPFTPILQKTFESDLPPEILARKPCSWPTTLDFTLLAASYVRQIFRDHDSIVATLFSHAAVEDLLEDPSRMTAPWFGQSMRAPQLFAYIIQMDRWFKKYRVQLL